MKKDIQMTVNKQENIVWMLDKDLKLRFVNPEIKDITGISNSEMTGKSIVELLPEDTVCRASEAIKKISKSIGAVETFEAGFTGKDGQYIWVEFVLTGIFDEKGCFNGAFLVSKIINEKKEVEERMIRAQKLETVGQLAAGVAHEFNNLFSIINLAAESAKFQKTPGSYTKLIRTIFETTKQGIGISRRLEEFAKPPTGEIAEVDITALIKNCIMILSPETKKRNINIELKAGKKITACTDRDMLLQAVFNIVQNALHATENYIGNIKIGIEKKRQETIITVKDNGRGIKEENIKKIFNPFYTTKGALGDGKERGVGLGLPISYSIIKNLKGEISVRSVEEKGTEVIIKIMDLDRIDAREDKEIIKERFTGKKSKKKTAVLIVDSDEKEVKLIENTLVPEKFEILKINSLKKAVKVFTDKKPEIVIIEHTGRDDEILRTADSLRKINPFLPVILISCIPERKMNNIRSEGTSFGIRDILFRPLDTALLIKTIKKYILF